ncbi:MAG: ABC transporter permease [Deferribacteraceae bacterium]|jgi:D-methionine transport system permease protein|nr:ABC transporter permease [Deferribacteraceae bacterium]
MFDLAAISSPYVSLVGKAALETVAMTAGSTLFSLLLGLPLGVVLCVTSNDNLLPLPFVNNILGRVVNALRSFPFIILMILIFPLSRIIVGTTIGTAAAIVPLSVAAAPFVARIIESALKEVDPGALQAAKAMGSTNMQIIVKVMLPEAKPSLTAGITLAVINIIGYSAMAGAIGGGGLGDVAIRYGYQRFDTPVLIAAVVLILFFVEITQFLGSKIADNMIKKR